MELNLDNIKSEPTLKLIKKKIRNRNVNPVHVEYEKPIQILASILPIVLTNQFYHAHNIVLGSFESILICYLYYVQFNRL